MARTVFLLAGFRTNTSATHAAYDDFREQLAAKGYKVVAVDIPWKHKTHTKFVAEFMERYKKYRSEENIVIGNSFGAIVALLSVVEFQPDRIILCSLSPFFKETLQDQAWFEYAQRRFGSRRAHDLKGYSVITEAKKVNKMSTKVDVLYGEYEKRTVPWLVDFVRKYHRYFDKATLVQAKGAPHSLKDPVYQKVVLELL